MNALLSAVLAVLSIWDYPARQPTHEILSRQFAAAVREGDTQTMIETCRKGVRLLPDDPTWQYNLACSLAYLRNPAPALDALEKAIDLGWRDVAAIERDTDLKRLEKQVRFREILEMARETADKPLLTGPLANVPATGVFGESLALGAQNFAWDFDFGCFVAQLKLAQGSSAGNEGDLYMNRDALHSPSGPGALQKLLAEFPGLTSISLDAEGRQRKMDLDFPNILFPYPVFGNCSRAQVGGPYWRSLPRALMTTQAQRLKAMVKLYLSNQIWVFPANADCAPIGTKGDVFASVTPYWIVTAGRSWSDLPYLRAALEASRALDRKVKAEIVRRGLLAPTVQMLLRRSLKAVESPGDYLTAKAHPTAMPTNGVFLARLKKQAAALTVEKIPPLAVITVKSAPVAHRPTLPETTYATAFAWATVLRAGDSVRTFTVSAAGAPAYAFRIVHDERGAARLKTLSPTEVELTIDRRRLTPTNRIDVAVFAKSETSDWGAPSYASFAVVDPSAPYSDPALTTLDPPAAAPAAKK
jgi:hypothetical protein